jgi:HEAT repeat protein
MIISVFSLQGLQADVRDVEKIREERQESVSAGRLIEQLKGSGCIYYGSCEEFSDYTHQTLVAKILFRIDPPVRNPEYNCPIFAADCMGFLEDSRYLEPLREQLFVAPTDVDTGDGVLSVREAIIAALGSIGDPVVLPDLALALQDFEGRAKVAALDALKQFKTKARPYQSLIEEMLPHEPRKALDALGALQSEEAAVAIAPYLEPGSPYFSSALMATSRLGSAARPLKEKMFTLLKEDNDPDIRHQIIGILSRIESLAEEDRQRLIPLFLQSDESKLFPFFRIFRDSHDRAVVETLVRRVENSSSGLHKSFCRNASSLYREFPDLTGPILETQLLEEKPSSAALRALGRYGSLTTLRRVVKLLSNEKVFVQKNASRVLVESGTAIAPLVPELSRYRDVQDAVVARKVYQALSHGLVIRDSDRELMRPAFRHENQWVRRTAMDSIQYWRAKQFVPELTLGLQDKYETVRVGAAEALEALGKEAATAVPAMLMQVQKEKGNSVAISSILTALRASGDQRAQSVVLTYAKDTFPRLQEAVKSDKWKTRYNAIKKIGIFGYKPEVSLGILQRALHDEHHWVRFASLQASAQFGVQAHSILSDIKKLLEDPENYIRWEAARTVSLLLPEKQPSFVNLLTEGAREATYFEDRLNYQRLLAK